MKWYEILNTPFPPSCYVSSRAAAGFLCRLQKQEILGSLSARRQVIYQLQFLYSIIPFCNYAPYISMIHKHDSGEELINIEADDLYALPYKSIKPLIESGQVDLV